MYKVAKATFLKPISSETIKDASFRVLEHIEEYSSAVKIARWALSESKEIFEDPMFRTTIADSIEIDNFLGLAAGWSKNAESLLGIQQLFGLGYAEVGTVLQHPQPGNPKERMWRLSRPNAPNEEATMNRMGFPSAGVAEVRENLYKYRELFNERDINFPIGISLGKNSDMSTKGMNILIAHHEITRNVRDMCDYLAINVSCPNIPNADAFKDASLVNDIIAAMKDGMLAEEPLPIFIKISPDLVREELNDIIRIVFDNDLAGIIATNTTTSLEIKGNYGRGGSNDLGGIAGSDPSYQGMSTSMIGYIYRETNGKIQIIGVGGVNDTQSAIDKIVAGALPLQMLSGFSHRGPVAASSILRELAYFMDQEGIRSINDLRGLAYPGI